MRWKHGEKRLIGGLGASTYLSGLTLFIFSRFIRVYSTIGEQHHPGERWVRLIHSSLTYVAIFGLGYLWKAHVLPGWKGDRRKSSGATLLGIFSVLWLSAIAILYLGESEWTSVASWIHSLVGLSLPLLLLVHLQSLKLLKLSALR